MTQADLARLCDLVRGVSRLALGVLGVAAYLLVRPVVRSALRQPFVGKLRQYLVAVPVGDALHREQHLGHGETSTCGGGQVERGGAQGVTGLIGEADGDIHDRYGNI